MFLIWGTIDAHDDVVVIVNASTVDTDGRSSVAVKFRIQVRVEEALAIRGIENKQTN